MDGARFDGLARMWANRGTRRDALRALAAAPLGALAAPSLATSAAGTCQPPHARCRKKTDCCTGRCNRKHRHCRDCPKGAHYCPATQSCLPDGQCCADADCRSHCYQGACCTQQQFEVGLCAPLGSCSAPKGVPGCCQTDADCRDGCYQGTCCVDVLYDSGQCGPLGACFNRVGSIPNCCTTDDQCTNLCPRGQCCTTNRYEVGLCVLLGACACG